MCNVNGAMNADVSVKVNLSALVVFRYISFLVFLTLIFRRLYVLFSSNISTVFYKRSSFTEVECISDLLLSENTPISRMQCFHNAEISATCALMVTTCFAASFSRAKSFARIPIAVNSLE